MKRKILSADPASNFPFKSGMGMGTEYELRCDFCGTLHNKDLNEDESSEGESVQYVKFGRFTIADCCFRDLESFVSEWVPEIIAWLEFLAQEHLDQHNFNTEMASRGRNAFKKL